jgi:amyloid beta precursor protein binding protein 1
MIVSVNLPDVDLMKLAHVCQEGNKTLIAVKSKGLVGFFSIQAPEHTGKSKGRLSTTYHLSDFFFFFFFFFSIVIETHPENVIDLRLSNPFQQLSDYISTFDLDNLDQTDHAHVPFVIIILKYVEVYKAEHEGQLPQTYSQRQELIKMIRQGMRTPDEENFEEAIANVWRLAPSNNVS